MTMNTLIDNNKYIYLLLLCFSLHCLPNSAIGREASDSKVCMVFHDPEGAGMFATFSSVLGFLDRYDKGTYIGLKVDFHESGLYYEPTHGSNWWQYYCEPINLGRQKNCLLRLSDTPVREKVCYAAEKLPRKRAHSLIQKYIKVKNHITQKVQQFKNENFKDYFVIGVHYRGTDKKAEAPRVSYEYVINTINEQINEHFGKRYRIFVATDEQAFLDHIQQLYPQKVIATNAIRSVDGRAIHYNTATPFIQGKQALIDVLLLSNCQVLIRTSSYLSLWATFFNPKMPVIRLNTKYMGE